MKYNITVSEQPEKTFEEFLEDQIRAYNNAHSPYHREVRKPRVRLPLNIIVQNDNEDFIGGLSATTYWQWLDIEDFYLPKSLRGQGGGTSILKTAETIAIARGCHHAFLTTYEFQARHFYEKQGYYVVGTMEGYPPGSAYYWMRKELL